ncbi:hypothetical protein QYE76_030651 [Lolium multiflorum]|uniref:Uncharacterized protein n=1 Tax=Lolium multiflorum TaxID=4521 RepID=A0AAD8VJI9_LOLMU|nr:hypothetical protein QYE76_030651 [Lolium multiflorum]
MAAVDLGSAEWERSKITNQDINLLKKLGISKKPKAVCFPSEESYPTPPMGYRPMMKELFRIGAQFIGYRDYASKTEEKLAEVNERANTLAQKLEQSEEALKKAESDAVQARREADKAKTDAAGVEDLRKRLHDAETSLSEHITAQSSCEEAILKRLREKVALQQAQDAITEKDAAVAEAAAATSRENFMLQLLTDASFDMAGSFLDAATEDERVEARSNVLLRLAKDHGSSFWGTPERTHQIVRFQDRALQVRDYLDFCTRTLSLVYGTMFPRNKMPETLPALMDKFRDAPRIYGFVRAQLAAGARFSMIMIKICYPKLDVGQIVPKCLAKMAKRKKNFGKYDDIVTPVAEDMMDELLRMDAEFFVKGSYAEHSTRAINNECLTIDNILGNP